MSATLSSRIDDDLERELSAVANAAHRPKGDIVREAINGVRLHFNALRFHKVFMPRSPTSHQTREPKGAVSLCF